MQHVCIGMVFFFFFKQKTAYEMSTNRDGSDVVDAACAIELVHCCTLIVDDLPCVDNAAVRRSQPTCHNIYGEAVTIYASHLLYSIAERLSYENAISLGVSGQEAWYHLIDLRKRLIESQESEINFCNRQISP